LHLAAFGAELEQQRTASYRAWRSRSVEGYRNCRCFERTPVTDATWVNEEMDDKSEQFAA
jgi:hypothetical protein